MNKDVRIMSGIRFVRNRSKISFSEPYPTSGINRFYAAIANFWKSHSISIDLFDEEARAARQKKPGGGGGTYMEDMADEFSSSSSMGSDGYSEGGGNKNKNKDKDNKGGLISNMMNKIKKRFTRKKSHKGLKNTFLVLLGIFGLTVPLTIKALAVIAAKALLASNAAMLIVAGVALRKIFEHREPKYQEEGPTIKVHTLPTYETQEEEHDRMGYEYELLTYAPSSPYGHYSYVPTV